MKILKTIETGGAAFNLRTPVPADKSFVTHSWIKAFRKEFEKADVKIGEKTFCEGQAIEIRDIFSRPGHILIVACNQFDPDLIYGYLVGEIGPSRVYLHWIYVKGGLRGHGIGSALFDALRGIAPDYKVIATHFTPAFNRFRKGRNISYQPLKWDLKGHVRKKGKPESGKVIKKQTEGGEAGREFSSLRD